MNYQKEILNKLLDIYERRGYYKRSEEEMRSVSLIISEEFPEYKDYYEHKKYLEINFAVEALIQDKFVEAKSTSRGTYEKVTLNVNHLMDAYANIKRSPLMEKCDAVINVLERYSESEYPMICNIISDFLKKIENGKKIPYGIEYDAKRLDTIIQVMIAILKLDSETYTRNFSLAYFKDSKAFQNEYKKTIQSILYDYTETSLSKERILEVYNIYDNPTYVYIKGKAGIRFKQSCIYLEDIPGGIAISEKSLNDITEITVLSNAVTTVENLTTFHDCNENDALYIYLGGFHNKSKEKLLKLIYKQNLNKTYYHKGDLDVYGFSILESLKERTSIPFIPYEMDIDTLRKFYNAGLYRPLTETDKKAMKSPKLQQYKEIFDFMIQYNCKIEQESLKAIDLIK